MDVIFDEIDFILNNFIIYNYENEHLLSNSYCTFSF
jgi:hypothetical protein